MTAATIANSDRSTARGGTAWIGSAAIRLALGVLAGGELRSCISKLRRAALRAVDIRIA
jgi:hypothetical protein